MSIQVLQSQLECYFKEIEKQLDSAFNNINNQIDQVFNIDSPISHVSNPQLGLSEQKIPQFCLIDTSKYYSNFFQLVKPLIISKIQQHAQLKVVSDQENEEQLILSELEQQMKFQSSLKPFDFQIMKENSISQDQSCLAIAFNNDCSKVILSCNKQIKIYEFQSEIFKQIKVLNQHQNSVFTLTFMKKSNQFISGDAGGSILIWSSNDNNQWNCYQKIQAHNNSIRCVILNNNEDLFISSSEDPTIKFWVKQNDWICQQTITDHKNSVYQLSLNDSQNKVISCGYDNLILIIEYSKYNKKWIVIQNIKVECYGYRIFFINNNQFKFQPYQGNLMHIYEMNSVSKQFIKTKDIVVNQSISNIGGLFPCQFIKQKQLLVSKHDKCVNLIRKTNIDEFKVEQSIQFDTNYLYGQMSDDGEYLITWDDSSKQIQVRKYIEQ